MTAPPRTGSLPDLLRSWIVGQRWYAGKGMELEQLLRLGGVRLDVPEGGSDEPGEVMIEIHVVHALTADGTATTYQVPLTFHTQPEPGLEHAEIGVCSHPDLGDRHVYDAPHDPAFVAALLRLLGGRSTVPVEDEWGTAAGGAVGVMHRAEPPRPGAARVLSTEQSNTSIVVGADGPDPVIIKLFRVLQPGSNPDVTLQTRLAAAGCDRVPRPVGWVEGSWPLGPEAPLAAGHLAYACEFVTDGVDGWRMACRAVEAGVSFDAQARELGLATAEVHAVLARILPTVQSDTAVLNRLVDSLAGRVHWAMGLVPALEPFADAALRAVDVLGSLAEPPPLQQLHGDYHLGQVLYSPTRGWVLLDFEGEPLRPLAERFEQDLALRDVAGMLRSFDYAARHLTVPLRSDDPRTVTAHEWSRQTRAAFLAGYAAGGGRLNGRTGSSGAALLRALEIDKALYEVVYETLNRPGWVSIPLSALTQLTAD